MGRCGAILVSVLLASTATAVDDPYAGRFVSGEDVGFTLELRRGGDGRYEGLISAEGESVGVTAMRDGSQLRGLIMEEDGSYGFTAQLVDGGALVLVDEDGEMVVFRREGATSSEEARIPGSSVEQSVDDDLGEMLDQTVVINGKLLNKDEVSRLVQYGVQPYSGRYWYDSTCGAWGMEGGPTLGFLAPNIPAAPLDPQASDGDTGVFINGRHLPVADLYALQLLTGPLLAGRYFIDAYGNAGAEGGPAVINLVVAAQQAQAQGRDGELGSWSAPISGASGNAAGGSGYVILKSPTGSPTTVGY